MQTVGGSERTVRGCQDPPALRSERHPPDRGASSHHVCSGMSTSSFTRAQELCDLLDRLVADSARGRPLRPGTRSNAILTHPPRRPMPKRSDAASSRFAARRDPTPRRINPSRSERLDAAPKRRGPPETARGRAEANRSLTDSTPHGSTRPGRDDSGPHARPGAV